MFGKIQYRDERIICVLYSDVEEVQQNCFSELVVDGKDEINPLDRHGHGSMQLYVFEASSLRRRNLQTKVDERVVAEPIHVYGEGSTGRGWEMMPPILGSGRMMS